MRRESSRERNGQGENGPGSERTRERIGPGPIGRFAPRREWAGSEKARYLRDDLHHSGTGLVNMWNKSSAVAETRDRLAQ